MNDRFTDMFLTASNDYKYVNDFRYYTGRFKIKNHRIHSNATINQRSFHRHVFNQYNIIERL